MQNLNEIVDLYLKMDTNYALLITGDWGIGKTYYFRNILKERISKTPTYRDNQKKYRPILISLFGLKSIEEIQLEIFLCLYPILRDNKFKLGSNIIKAITKGILYVKGFGEFNKYIDEIEVKNEVLINFEDIVVCFDDLERLSQKLNIKEFIGFINSLVENENVKVLIIANENKIQDKYYSTLKEKVIGNSIEFIPDFDRTFDSILHEKFDGFKVYKKFLGTNKQFILNLFRPKSSNFRILIFCLTYFHSIFSEIENKLSDEETLLENKDDILLNLLRFSLAISVYYREGKISFKNRMDLDIPEGFDISAVLIARKRNSNNLISVDTKDKPENEKLIEEFYQNEVYYYYNSIYEYLTGGGNFNYSKLITELKRIYHIQDNVIQPHYIVYNALGYQKCFSLNDKDYLRLTRELLEYAKKGYYEIPHYMSIFHYITRFNNPLNISVNKLESTLIKGMKNGKRHHKFDPQLDMVLSFSADALYKDSLLKIREVAISLNDSLRSESKSAYAKELEKLCYSDFDAFLEKFYDKKESIYNDPFFEQFNADRFYSFFYNSKPEIKWKISSLFYARYGEFPPKRLKSEVPFLQKLITRLNRKNKILKGKNLSGYVYHEFEKHLKSAIDKLSD
jgi:hypothetical protein